MNAAHCLDKSYTLQLLGSGGPISDDARASSGYIIWINGKSRFLVDSGGGVYLRFGESGAKIEDLELFALTHFHTDHVADLPAILKGAYFTNRTAPLYMVGPTGSGTFPSMSQFLDREFDKKSGAFAYLHGLQTGTDGLFKLIPQNVDFKLEFPTKVYENAQTKVFALGIPHGDVPCLAYRIEGSKGVVVISGDQNGTNKAFINFAKGADVLVMPLAIDEGADAESSFMHAKPSVIGAIANQVRPKVLVLNHFMGKGLALKDESIDIVKKFYSGKIYSARDLACYPLDIK